ncbi:hypothetical protein [Streptomyces sp. NPDC050804]|uniref:hypothetical protein n=1 Tax=Streptomyces sp. NPDC050804 TaxID=3154745 RepID=UPI003425B32F
MAKFVDHAQAHGWDVRTVQETAPGEFGVIVAGRGSRVWHRFSLVWRKGRFASAASTEWTWECGGEERSGIGSSDALGIRGVTAFIAANPQPDPEPEEMPVKVVQDWHRGENFDPSARERMVECGGVFYRVGNTMGSGLHMSFSLRGGNHIHTGMDWADIEQRIREHRAELFATLGEGEGTPKILTTSKGVQAQVWDSGRTGKCYAHCGWRCDVECVCEPRPVLSVDEPTMSYVWEDCPECVAEKCGFRLETLPIDWTPPAPEECPDVVESVHLVEDRTFGVGMRLMCECGECSRTETLHPVIRADQGRPYMNMASVAPRAVTELLAELGYELAGAWESRILGLNGANANGRVASVRSLGGVEGMPEPDSVPESAPVDVIQADHGDSVTLDWGKGRTRWVVTASWREMAFLVVHKGGEFRITRDLRENTERPSEWDRVARVTWEHGRMRTQADAEAAMVAHVEKRRIVERQAHEEIDAAAQRSVPEWKSDLFALKTRRTPRRDKTPEQILAAWGDAVTFEEIEDGGEVAADERDYIASGASGTSFSAGTRARSGPNFSGMSTRSRCWPVRTPWSIGPAVSGSLRGRSPARP